MADAVRVDGLREFQKALRDVERAAPKELRKVLLESMKDVELVASARTPRGNTGRLQASNKVAVSGAKIALRNNAPYANTLHWGRRVWPSVKSPAPPSGRQKHTSVVRARPWFYDTLQEQRDVIGRNVIRSVELLFEREVSR